MGGTCLFPNRPPRPEAKGAPGSDEISGPPFLLWARPEHHDTPGPTGGPERNPRSPLRGPSPSWVFFTAVPLWLAYSSVLETTAARHVSRAPALARNGPGSAFLRPPPENEDESPVWPAGFARGPPVCFSNSVHGPRERSETPTNTSPLRKRGPCGPRKYRHVGGRLAPRDPAPAAVSPQPHSRPFPAPNCAFSRGADPHQGTPRGANQLPLPAPPCVRPCPPPGGLFEKGKSPTPTPAISSPLGPPP